ncbi:hypothetical protein BH20ACI1_BH20ACI1_19030 [soil metagenome]
MEQLKIFYSWQSDHSNLTNRTFIQDALEKATKLLRNDDSLEVNPVVDRDTKDEPGSPDIVHSIFDKIENSAVFVCDVTIINDETDKRPTPNPNVLIELGYALKALGQTRVLLIMNTSYGEIKKLPFDLDHRRVITYGFHETDNSLTRTNDKGKEESVKQIEKRILVKKLESNLKTILDHHSLGEDETSKTSQELLEESFANSASYFQVKQTVLNEIKATCEKINSLEVLSKNAYLTPDELAEYMANCLALSSESLNLFAFGCSEGELTYSKVWAEALTHLTDCIAPTRTIDEIRLFPALLHFYAGGITAVAGEKFENLSSLINQTKIRTHRGKTENPAHSLVPYKVIKEDDAKSLPNFGRYHTPLNQYLFAVLRELLQTVIVNEQAYKEAFYRFEYLFALATSIEAKKIYGEYLVPVGSYAWETYFNDIQSTGIKFVTKQTDYEIEQLGKKWQPFQAGIFGNSWEDFFEMKNSADDNLVKTVVRILHFNPLVL